MAVYINWEDARDSYLGCVHQQVLWLNTRFAIQFHGDSIGIVGVNELYNGFIESLFTTVYFGRTGFMSC